ncbi:MAG: HIT family protein [Pseudomonadota bacterium]
MPRKYLSDTGADKCIFCRIVAGEAPAVKLFEDERVLGFLDIRPLRPGHALVIPKRHCRDLRDCPPEDLAPLLAACRSLAPALLEATGSDGFNLIASNGEAAGQEVFHLHFHLMPRRSGDGFTRIAFAESVARARRAELDELSAMGDSIRAAWRGQGGS